MKIVQSYRVYWLAAWIAALLAFAPLEDMRAAGPEKGRQEKGAGALACHCDEA